MSVVRVAFCGCSFLMCLFLLRALHACSFFGGFRAVAHLLFLLKDFGATLAADLAAELDNDRALSGGSMAMLDAQLQELSDLVRGALLLLLLLLCRPPLTSTSLHAHTHTHTSPAHAHTMRLSTHARILRSHR